MSKSSLKNKKDLYEITFSAKSDPNTWNTVRVNEDMLVLKVAEVLGNKNIQLECVALIATSKPNKYDLPTPP